MEFVSALVRSLAWPAAIVAAALILKKPIAALLSSEALKHVRLGSNILSFEFDRSVAGAAEKLIDGPAIEEATVTEGAGQDAANVEAEPASTDRSGPRAAERPAHLEGWTTHVAGSRAGNGAKDRTYPRDRVTQVAATAVAKARAGGRNVTARERNELLNRLPRQWRELRQDPRVGDDPLRAVRITAAMLKGAIADSITDATGEEPDWMYDLEQLAEVGLLAEVLTPNQAMAVSGLATSRRIAEEAPITRESAQNFVNVATALAADVYDRAAQLRAQRLQSSDPDPDPPAS